MCSQCMHVAKYFIFTDTQQDLAEHLATCSNVKCRHDKYGCPFLGTAHGLSEHLAQCQYEPIKDFLHENERRLSAMELDLKQKDAEIGFLRSMLSKMSERLDGFEKDTVVKVGELSQSAQR